MYTNKSKRELDPLRRRPKSASLYASGGEHKVVRPISAGGRIWSGGWVFARHRCIFGETEEKTANPVAAQRIPRSQPPASLFPSDSRKFVHNRRNLRPQTAPAAGKALDVEQPRRATSATKRVRYACQQEDSSLQDQTLPAEAANLSLSTNGNAGNQDLSADGVAEISQTPKSSIMSLDDLDANSNPRSLRMKKSLTLNDLVRKTTTMMSVRGWKREKADTKSAADHYGEEAPHAWYCKLCGQNGPKVKWWCRQCRTHLHTNCFVSWHDNWEERQELEASVLDMPMHHRNSTTSFDPVSVAVWANNGKTPRAFRRYEQIEMNKSPWKLPVDEHSLLDTPNVNKETASLIHAHLKVMHNNTATTKKLKERFLGEDKFEGDPQENDEDEKNETEDSAALQLEWDSLVRTPSVETDALNETNELKDFARSSVTVIARVTSVMKRFKGAAKVSDFLAPQDPLQDLRTWIETLSQYPEIEEKFKKSLCKVQSLYRGFVARKKVKHLKNEFLLGYTWPHMKAALRIQGRFRGIKARLRYKYKLTVMKQWKKLSSLLLLRSFLRLSELIKRALAASKQKTVVVSKKNSDLRIHLFGYTVGQNGLLGVPEGIRMLGKGYEADNFLTFRTVKTKKPTRTRYVHGKTFPFMIWKNVKAPKWSLLSKDPVLLAPASLGCTTPPNPLYKVTYSAVNHDYYCRIIRLQDVPTREDFFRELDALLRLRTLMSKKRIFDDDDDGDPNKKRATMAMAQEIRSYQRMFVACVNVCIDQSPPPKLVMVLEAQDTNLHQISTKIMPEAVMSTVIHQVLQALFYVHKLGIIHG
mmetsp:Transcript_26266/g.59619  ORF Transcript_26266/g.59619 Transcript_26266/m.59619 type:complete len:813 (+) Transcript_26266:166-2604(+)